MVYKRTRVNVRLIYFTNLVSIDIKKYYTTSFKWFNKKYSFQALSKCRLAIGFKNGRVQLMESTDDITPKLIDTQMQLRNC